MQFNIKIVLSINHKISVITITKMYYEIINRFSILRFYRRFKYCVFQLAFHTSNQQIFKGTYCINSSKLFAQLVIAPKAIKVSFCASVRPVTPVIFIPS